MNKHTAELIKKTAGKISEKVMKEPLIDFIGEYSIIEIERDYYKGIVEALGVENEKIL